MKAGFDRIDSELTGTICQSRVMMQPVAAASTPHHHKSAALSSSYCTSLHTKLSVLSAENPPPGGFSASNSFPQSQSTKAVKTK
jgi:hypothetical protein